MAFVITSATPARFDGDFTLSAAPGTTPTQPEATYLTACAGTLTRLAGEEAADTAQDPSGALTLAKRACRKQAASELHQDAAAFVAGTLDPVIASQNTPVIWGRYTALRDRLLRSLFVARETLDATNTYAVDLKIRVASNLPKPDDTPSPEKQALFVAIDSALSVIRTVCHRLEDRADRLFAITPQPLSDRARRLRDEYIRKLAGIARLGLEGPHTTLANLALNGLKQDFVSSEAARIKNDYLRGLGTVAALTAALCLGAYALIDTGEITRQFWVGHKAFLLAGAGSAVGTWLSFGVRKVALRFDDLANLEEDLLDPSLRVLFVLLLTETACLLFWKNAINIEIGGLRTADFRGSVSMLVGIFAGISERALATAVASRAATFIKTIGN